MSANDTITTKCRHCDQPVKEVRTGRNGLTTMWVHPTQTGNFVLCRGAGTTATPVTTLHVLDTGSDRYRTLCGFMVLVDANTDLTQPLPVGTYDVAVNPQDERVHEGTACVNCDAELYGDESPAINDHTDAATRQDSDYAGVTTADLAEIIVALAHAPATLQVMAVIGRVRAELNRRDMDERQEAQMAVNARRAQARRQAAL